jgi:hypothetical protein
MDELAGIPPHESCSCADFAGALRRKSPDLAFSFAGSLQEAEALG